MRPRNHKARSLSFETLEIREVKTAAITSALLENGVLSITGTDYQDSVQISSSASGVVVQQMMLLPGQPIEVPVRNLPISIGNSIQYGLQLSQVNSILMNVGKGNDRVTLKTDIRSTVYGGDGNDILIGGQGMDSLYGGIGDDQLHGGGGIDGVYGGDGNDRLFGSAGNDYLYGGTGNDQLFGGDGLDWLYGESGDDYLNGGVGDDHIDGGSGVDTFRRNLLLPGSGLSLSSNGGDEDMVPPDDPSFITGIYLTENSSSDSVFDINQDGSPTCAFLATLSSLAKRTGTTDDLVSRIQYDAASDRYGINFFVHGTKTITLSEGSSGIINIKPITTTIQTVETKTVWVNGDWTESRDPGGKLWVALYQKAYLQLLGATTRDGNGATLESSQWKSVAGKEWNHVGDIFFALTGSSANFVSTSNAKAQTMFDQLNASNSKGMVASSLDSGTTNGIIANHCYSVYKIFKDTTGNWLVRLRNPWAVDGRNGSMYDLNGTQQQYANDGLITLTWSQFTNNFRGYYNA